MSATITVFLPGCGSNKDDLTGKLRFNVCTDLEEKIHGDQRWLYFNYRGKGGYGATVTASFNMGNIIGYVVEKS